MNWSVIFPWTPSLVPLPLQQESFVFNSCSSYLTLLHGNSFPRHYPGTLTALFHILSWWPCPVPLTPSVWEPRASAESCSLCCWGCGHESIPPEAGLTEWVPVHLHHFLAWIRGWEKETTGTILHRVRKVLPSHLASFLNFTFLTSVQVSCTGFYAAPGKSKGRWIIVVFRPCGTWWAPCHWEPWFPTLAEGSVPLTAEIRKIN